MLRARARALGKTDAGAATVEFALLLPVLLLILFGIVEAGRAFNMHLSMSHGAREGVRILALGGSTTDAVTRTQQAAFPTTGLGIATAPCPNVVSLTTPPARVTVTRTYNFITPMAAIAGLIPGGSLAAAPTLTARGEMRCSG